MDMIGTGLLKRLVNRLARSLAYNDFAWKLIGVDIANGGRRLWGYRREKCDMVRPRNSIDLLLNEFDEMIEKDLVVKTGPFAGMRYPSSNAACSVFYPKLLGTYERELHPILKRILVREYDLVIDVGCAEGYYAVGMAMQLPNADVYAYDIDHRARLLCSEMADFNDVGDRVVVKSFCSPETLLEIDFKGRCLIICDCEGYEKELFTPEVAKHLEGCDILIETHDVFDITISTVLNEVFSETHRQEVILSIDDIQKAKTYDVAGFENESLEFKRAVVGEGRKGIMEWFYLESKNYD